MFAVKRGSLILILILLTLSSVLALTGTFYWYDAGSTQCATSTKPGEAANVQLRDPFPFTFNCCDREGYTKVVYCVDGVCSSQINAYNINWDSDRSSCICYGKTWMSSGTCCGDDPNEYLRSRVCGSLCTSDSNDQACCTQSNACVYSGTCYNSGSCFNGMYCSSGTWYDIDQNAVYCTTCIGGEYWDLDGQYESKKPDCCGDDAAEYLVTSGIGSQTKLGACCDNPNDCMDRSGRCRSGGSAETNCNDGIDNDCDGKTDCSDPDCSANAACVGCSPEVCNDKKDNDCDNYIDCADNDCLGSPYCQGCTVEICNDGIDNDCDGKVDCADNDCIGIAPCENCVPEICNNGIDDDCDGLVDGADWDCGVNCPEGTTLCSDGICKEDCGGGGPKGCVNENGKCEEGEGCGCVDCYGKKDSCEEGNVCNSNTKLCGCGVGLIRCPSGLCEPTCNYCGNGIIDENSGEVCDTTLPSGMDCVTLGFTGGTLECTNCSFNTYQCTGTYGACGDGRMDVGENCDGSDWGSIGGCSDLGFVDGVLACASDCKFDTSGCYDVPSCGSDDDCPIGAVCGEDGRCGCPDGMDLCSDGSCSEDCDSTDDGYVDCINTDGVCEFGEGCHCADCVDGDRASCDISSSCFSSFCKTCTLTSALWDADNCNGDLCVVANGSLVDFYAVGNDVCSGKSFSFMVFEGDEDNVVDYPTSAVFSDDRVISSWKAYWIDVSGWFGFGADDPVYTLYVSAPGVVPITSDNKITVCDKDDDCDEVANEEDQCPNTPFGDSVKTSGTYKGCSDSQVSCVSQIDCSAVEWSDCDANGLRTRMICKDSSGKPFFDESGSCCNQQSTCRCSLGGCLDRGNWIPTVRECLIEEEFPFFTAVNLLVVLSLLLCYYFFVQIRRKK